MDNKVDGSTWVRVTIIVAIIGCIGALGAAFISILPDMLRPTPNAVVTEAINSPSETQSISAESSSKVLYFSDDFNSGADFNKDFWGKFESDGCNVRQRNNQVEFNSIGVNSADSVCIISAEGVPFEQAGTMEASFRTSSAGTGDLSNGAIEFSKGTFEEGTKTWIIECGIMQMPNQSQIVLFFNVNSAYPQGEAEMFKTIPAKAEQWYRMKLVVDANSNKIICYGDGEIIGTYDGNNLAELYKENLDRKLIGFWLANAQALFYADDVILSSSK